MTFENIVEELRILADKHTQIQSFYTGLKFEHNNSNIIYPALRVSFPFNVQDIEEDKMKFTFTLSLLVNEIDIDLEHDINVGNINYNTENDMLNELDNGLKLENLLREKSLRIMSQYLSGLTSLENNITNDDGEYEYFEVESNYTIKSLERVYNDSVTGVECQISITVGNIYFCQSEENLNQSVWKEDIGSTINLNNIQSVGFPTTCGEILPLLTTDIRNNCLLKTYDFSDTNVQMSLDPSQVDDLEDWLNPTVPITQYTMLLDGVNEYSRLYHDIATSFHSYDKFSVGGWMRTATLGGIQTIISKKAGTTSPGWSMFLIAGKLYIYLIANNSNRIRVQVTSLTFTLNTFYHVGFSYDGSSTASGLTIYIDGVSVPFTIDEDSLTLDIYSTFDIAIGGEFGWGYFFRGYLGYQRIWNIELSASDFLNEYNGGDMLEVSTQYPSLVLEWRSGENANYLNSTFGINYNGWCFNNPLNPYQVAQGFTVAIEEVDRTTVLP